jgi:putative DNA primase/helicase
MSDNTARIGRAIIESGKYAPPLDGDQPDAETPPSASESDSYTSNGQQQNTDRLLIYPPPTAPYAVAKQLYQSCRDENGVRTLLAYRGCWQLWRTTHWSEIDAAEVRARVYRALEHAVYIKGVPPEFVPWDPNKYKIANVLEAMSAIGHLSSETDTPAWIDAHTAKASAEQVIS